MKRTVFTRERIYLLFAITIITVWVAPYFILGEHAHMRIHDNLDSNITWYKVLVDSGQLFGSIQANIPQIMNGELSRNAFYSEYYGIVELFRLFPPVIAYGLNQAISRTFAFLGMYLLLKKYVIKGKKQGFIIIISALAFALTPFWPNGMLSIVGMPLALWAFLNIRNNEQKVISIFTITLLPFYSTFMLGFFFFLSAMGVCWLVDVIRSKKPQWRLFFSIAYMTLIYLAIEYRELASLVFSHVETNRSEFFESKNNLMQTIMLIFKNYIVGHNQDQTLFGIIILPVSLIALVIVLLQKSWKREKLFIGLHLANFLLSVWYAFWWYEGWVPLKQEISILNTFNFSRYHYLRPMIIYVLFALSLQIIWRYHKKWRIAAMVFAVLQIGVLIPSNEQIWYHHSPSFGQFYAVKEFADIKKFIGKSVEDYRVASIGLHPAIAQYNGLYTLDTYNNFYPLSYKQQFRKIIAPELAKNKTLESYFDQWGGRCYLFVDELGKNYMFSKHSLKVIHHLDMNIQAFKQMGGKYILSAVPIKNAKENHLDLLKVFQSKEAYWKIYLYKVI
ncbi:DUF6044 family protein [Neobacillus kokaensis]|uniref:Membrane protein YkoS n=1 Tax=Neobacillus kokaensis TaxID=2759023 RepID=A0ABQ3N5Z9_9BACI|nr:DUF6044 family protein [Neobacillus kokaensis]GHI00356.1 putative membrane protein YkoS [Neobacillus kokaensis]